MGSTFGTYNIATTGMYVSQASLTTVSHNLSNVNTTGFSRQRVVTAEQNILSSNGTSYDSGVGIAEISRVRSRFLDQTYRQENANKEYWSVKNTILEDAQSLLNEYGTSSTSSDNGLQQTIQDFFDSWEQLTKDPSSQSARSSVVEYAGAMVDTLDQINEQLSEMQVDSANRVKDGVDTLNSLAKQVAKLNTQITKAEASGGQSSDLQDQRDKLLDEMSALANISVSEQSDGTLDVILGGVSIVQGDKTHTLVVDETGSALQIEWAELGSTAKISSGSIKAYLDEADQSAIAEIDGNTTYNFTTNQNSSLGTLRQGLNDLITTITKKVNTLLESGIDLEGNTGEALFVKIDENKPFVLGNIQLNHNITADVDKIAAGASGATGDSTIASKISLLQSEKDFSCNSSTMAVTDFYQAIISWVGTTGDTASSNYDTQNTLLQQAVNQRDSISSVSQDEEMSKMIVYQNAYNASARVLSTIDSLIGDLIANLGR